LQKDYDKAAAIFKTLRQFLPALYMEMLCCYHLGHEKKRSDLHDLILKEEYRLWQEKRIGFLVKILPESINLNSPEWNKPFYKFAHSREISEGIALIYKYLDQYEQKHGNIPQWLKFIDAGVVEEAKQGLSAWQLLEESKQELEQFKLHLKQKGLSELRQSLFQYFPEIPRLDHLADSAAVERTFVQLVKADKAWQNLEKYQLLLEYLLHKNQLPAQSVIILNYYTYLLWLESCKKSGKPAVFKKVLESATKASLGTIVGSTVLQTVVSLPLSAFTSGVGAGFITLLVEYLKHEIKSSDEEISLPDYPQFKADFIRYISEMMDEHGDMFYARYPMFNYENWVRQQANA